MPPRYHPPTPIHPHLHHSPATSTGTYRSQPTASHTHSPTHPFSSIAHTAAAAVGSTSRHCGIGSQEHSCCCCSLKSTTREDRQVGAICITSLVKRICVPGMVADKTDPWNHSLPKPCPYSYIQDMPVPPMLNPVPLYDVVFAHCHR